MPLLRQAREDIKDTDMDSIWCVSSISSCANRGDTVAKGSERGNARVTYFVGLEDDPITRCVGAAQAPGGPVPRRILELEKKGLG